MPSELKYPEDGHTKAGLSSDNITANLLSDFWRKVICYGAVNSTNTLAVGLSLKYPESEIAIIADSQVKGKGRLGRAWVSPPGCNIYMSVVLHTELATEEATLLTIAAAVACASALRNKCGLDVNIKWPNDLMVCHRKIGGILTELKSGRGRINKLVVIGIGINVNSRLTDFPEELRSGATSLKEETGKYFERSGMIAEILNEFEKWYKKLLNEGRFSLLKEWRRLSSTLGTRVRVAMGTDIFSGFAEDIDEQGRLILKLASGARMVVSAGDLTELR